MYPSLLPQPLVMKMLFPIQFHRALRAFKSMTITGCLGTFNAIKLGAVSMLHLDVVMMLCDTSKAHALTVPLRQPNDVHDHSETEDHEHDQSSVRRVILVIMPLGTHSQRLDT
jgi:hypothetical protein